MEDTSPHRPGLFSRLRDGLRGARRPGGEPVRTVRVALNAYGKLPIYKDFISVGLTDPGAREFRTWLDRGFSHRWSADDGYRETEIPRHLFLLRLPESGVLAAGSLWGSRDEGGLRRFPFTLFATLPEGHRAADPLTATESLEAMGRQADAVDRDFGPGGALATFYQAYRGAELEVPVKPSERIRREARADLERLTVSALAGALFGPEAPARWPALLSGLDAFAGASRGEGARAARVPLSGTLPRSRELQFWLLRMARVGAGRNVTGLLYPAGSGAARATVFLRDLRPEDFLLLHPGRSDYPYAEDLGSVAGAAPSGAAAPADWDRPLATLLDD
jgi:type VI secretion system ImpM family protein